MAQPDAGHCGVLATDLTEPLVLDLAAGYAHDGAGRAPVVVAPVRAVAGSHTAALAAGRAELGLSLSPDPALYATPLGYVRLRVVVQPANTRVELTAAEVQALFTGARTDWADLGGAGGQVQVVVREPGDEAAHLFSQQALHGAAPTVNALVAPTWAAMRELVAADPNAIGYLPAHEVDASVKAVATPLELRALLVATAAAEPTGAARDFLAWAQSEAGQGVVSQRYEAATTNP